MLNRMPRYLPLLGFLDRHPGLSILEVGSGGSGLAEFRDIEFVGCDLAFQGEPPPGMLRVRARGEALPFPDGTFDLVICQDTLEHIPENLREGVVSELLRVSRSHLYISFPRGKMAYWADRAYGFYHGRIRKLPLPDWFLDHRKLPPVKVGEFERILREEGASFRKLARENVIPHVLLIMVEHFPRLNRFLLRFAERHPRAARLVLRIMDVPPTYRAIYFIEKS